MVTTDTRPNSGEVLDEADWTCHVSHSWASEEIELGGTFQRVLGAILRALGKGGRGGGRWDR